MENTGKTVSKKFYEAVKRHPGIIKVTYPNGRISYRAKIAPSLQFAKTISKDLVVYRQKLGEAVEWRERTLRALRDGSYESPEERIEREKQEAASALTYDQWWEVEAARRPWKPSTRLYCTRRYNSHIKPYWGSWKLTDITREAVLAWIAKTVDFEKYGTWRNTLDEFRSMLLEAEKQGLIEKVPIDKRDTVPPVGLAQKSQRHKPRALPYAEFTALVGRIPEEYRPLFMIGGFLGLRASELVGLQRHDIDLENRRLKIVRAVTGEGKYLSVGTPKTVNSVRELPIPEVLIPFFIQQLQACGADPQAWVFSNPASPGQVWNSDKMGKKIKALAEKAGISPFTTHDMRHTAASNLLNTFGFTFPLAVQIMGHGGEMILKRYWHGDTDHLRQLFDKAIKNVSTADNVLRFDRSAS